MNRTQFHISKMDCPSEENMIRMKLNGLPISKMEFDIAARSLAVYHEGEANTIANALEELKLGSTLVGSEAFTGSVTSTDESDQRHLLWTILIINASIFILESISGFIAQSMGLVADSLDMLADAIVYALSLYAVGKAAEKKKNVARISGYFQFTLAIFGLVEVIRRFIGSEEAPSYSTMVIVSLLALLANSISLYLMHRSKNREAHMQASLIFTSNDVIVNVGVIIAGGLVYMSGSALPDLIIGAIVFLLVSRGAYRILKLSA